MRAGKGMVCAILAVALAAGGCAMKPSMDKETPAETAEETVMKWGRWNMWNMSLTRTGTP